jgi:hypothetical protein
MHPNDMESAEDILPTLRRQFPSVQKSTGHWRRLVNSCVTSSRPRRRFPVVITDTIIPYVGTLLVVDRAQIANWFETRVGLNEDARILWLGQLPIAHAHTIFIVFRMREDPRYKKLKPKELICKAGKRNSPVSPPTLSTLMRNVLRVWRKKCLRIRPGPGLQVMSSGWGLDVGHHQDEWNPYLGALKNWNEKKRERSQGQCVARLLFYAVDYILFKAVPQVEAQPKPRPRPQPKKKVQAGMNYSLYLQYFSKLIS